MALSPQERSRRMRLNMLMAMSYAAFASSKSDPSAALLGTETQGLALDFLQDTYAVRQLSPIGTQTGKALNFVTFSRASNATVVDSDGLIKWAPHNLVLNSAAPSTQSITVISGAQYTVDMTGSGSIALSNAGSGTVTTGSPVTITASSTTLTLTLTGTVSTMWAYRSDLGGMQANASGSLYNVTTGSAYYGPRRDFDPVTLACKGLLVEEQRTNLLLNSATLSTQNVTVTAVVRTLSFYGTGTITLSGTSTAGPLVGTGANNRVSLTFTPTAGTLTLTVTGSVTQAQLEEGSFATSYIPTSASQVTRSADVATVSTQAFPYSSSEGTLVVNGSFLSLTAAGIYGLASLSTGSSGNSVNLFASPPNMIANIYAASAQTANYSIGTLTDPIKAAIAYKVNDVNAAVNGVAQTTDTSAAMPTGIDRLEIGRFWTSQTGNGWIRQITYLPRRISNTELQTRTS